MTVENKYALGVLKIADAHPNGLASFRRCRIEIPNLVKISPAELAPSQTRIGEPMWHQIIRNIKSHHADEGNFIFDGLLRHVPKVGYQITSAGSAYLRARGF